MPHIVKIGLVDVNDEGLLIVRKEGGRKWILPGGKPEAGESAEDALRREVEEELGCEVVDLLPMTVIHSQAADRPGDTVEVHCFSGRIVGDPTCAAEIAEFGRLTIDECRDTDDLAASIVEGLMPVLDERRRRYHVTYDEGMLDATEKARIDFGIEEDPDRGFGGCEMSIVWENVGRFEAMRISAYDESLGALSRMNEVVAELGSAHAARQVNPDRRETVTRAEVLAILHRHGFVDRSAPRTPNGGDVLYVVTRANDGRTVHNASAAWKAIEWCRNADMPFGIMLHVTESAIDADAAIDECRNPIRTFEFHDRGTPPIERDVIGRIVNGKGD